MRIRLDPLRVVNQTGEDDDTEDEEEDEQGEFFGGCAERLDEDLEPR